MGVQLRWLERAPDKRKVEGSIPSAPTIYPGVVQFGRTLDLGSRGRGFKSPHLVHIKFNRPYTAIFHYIGNDKKAD